MENVVSYRMAQICAASKKIRVFAPIYRNTLLKSSFINYSSNENKININTATILIPILRIAICSSLKLALLAHVK